MLVDADGLPVSREWQCSTCLRAFDGIAAFVDHVQERPCGVVCRPVPVQARPWPPLECKVAGCDRERWARGWCRSHYRRWERFGEVFDWVPIGELKGKV